MLESHLSRTLVFMSVPVFALAISRAIEGGIAPRTHLQLRGIGLFANVTRIWITIPFRAFVRGSSVGGTHTQFMSDSVLVYLAGGDFSREYIIDPLLELESTFDEF